MRFDVMVDVRLRGGIADPAGATIERALPALGYEGVTEVSVGKTVRFTIEAVDATEATTRAEDLCSSFLTNPVIEDASVTVEAAG
jgi:phosphoribosylformylglycinamidine synthase